MILMIKESGKVTFQFNVCMLLSLNFVVKGIDMVINFDFRHMKEVNVEKVVVRNLLYMVNNHFEGDY